MTASDPKRIDPEDPPREHLAIDPELGPPPEGYGGEHGKQEYDAADSERTTAEVVDVDDVDRTRSSS
jgi:hypothetical protein